MATRYDLLTGRKSDPSDEGSKTYFTKIGVMFANKNGNGFTLKLSALPLSIVNGEASIIAVEPKEKDAPTSPPASNSNHSPIDDDIPF